MRYTYKVEKRIVITVSGFNVVVADAGPSVSRYRATTGKSPTRCLLSVGRV